MLTFTELHDANLLSNARIDGEKVLIGVRQDSGKNGDLLLEGVERIRCNNFLEGNIVFSATLSTKSRVDLSKIRWILGASDGDEQDFVLDLQERILLGELSLFEVVPTIGAEIRALVQSVSCRW